MNPKAALKETLSHVQGINRYRVQIYSTSTVSLPRPQLEPITLSLYSTWESRRAVFSFSRRSHTQLQTRQNALVHSCMVIANRYRLSLDPGSSRAFYEVYWRCARMLWRAFKRAGCHLASSECQCCSLLLFQCSSFRSTSP